MEALAGAPVNGDIAERFEERGGFLHSPCLFIVVEMIVGKFTPLLLCHSRKPKACSPRKFQELTRVANAIHRCG